MDELAEVEAAGRALGRSRELSQERSVEMTRAGTGLGTLPVACNKALLDMPLGLARLPVLPAEGRSGLPVGHSAKTAP